MASRCELGRWEQELHRIGSCGRYNKLGLAEWACLCHTKGQPHFHGPCEHARCSEIAKQATFPLPFKVRWTMWRGIRDRDKSSQVNTKPVRVRLVEFIKCRVYYIWRKTQFVPVGGFSILHLKFKPRGDPSGKPTLLLDRDRVVAGWSRYYTTKTKHTVSLWLPRGWNSDEGQLSEKLGLFVLVREGELLVTVKVKAHKIKPLVQVFRYESGALSSVAQPEAAAIIQRLTAFKSKA